MEVVPYEKRLREDRLWARDQIDSFFMRTGPVYKALEDLARNLEQAGIPVREADRAEIGFRNDCGPTRQRFGRRSESDSR